MTPLLRAPLRLLGAAFALLISGLSLPAPALAVLPAPSWGETWRARSDLLEEVSRLEEDLDEDLEDGVRRGPSERRATAELLGSLQRRALEAGARELARGIPADPGWTLEVLVELAGAWEEAEALRISLGGPALEAPQLLPSQLMQRARSMGMLGPEFPDEALARKRRSLSKVAAGWVRRALSGLEESVERLQDLSLEGSPPLFKHRDGTEVAALALEVQRHLRDLLAAGARQAALGWARGERDAGGEGTSPEADEAFLAWHTWGREQVLQVLPPEAYPDYLDLGFLSLGQPGPRPGKPAHLAEATTVPLVPEDFPQGRRDRVEAFPATDRGGAERRPRTQALGRGRSSRLHPWYAPR